MDALILSRIQFAVTIAFHYIYPPISIGLGMILVIMEGMYLKTRNPLYEQMTRFWIKIFGLTFSIGVATGIVMEFQFGTNWAPYSRYVGDVFGSALAAEGVFAFFLESGFLALLLFGWNRIGPKMHFFATCMVSLGSMFSAVWIVVANSWMQTPAGFHIVKTVTGERAEITDFWALVFNPSSMDRLSHVLMGAWQSGAWFVLSVSAYYLIKKKHVDFAKASMKIGLLIAVIASLGQMVTGHSSAVMVSKYQPAKLAAMEGHFEAEAPAALNLLGIIDLKSETVKYAIGLPGMLSFMVSGNPSMPLKGLRSFPREDWPPVQATFQTYHLMIAIGMTLIALSLLGVGLAFSKRLFESTWYLKLLVPAVLLPQIANQVGWAAAEIGRQPWIVYGLLRTSAGVSRNVPAGQILASLILFTLVYILLFVLFIFLLDQKIKHGPVEDVKPDLLHRAS